MRNNPAFIKLIKYIDDNSVKQEQIISATPTQFLNIMFPDNNGSLSKSEHLTKELVLRGLKVVYQERLEEQRKKEIISLLKEQGITIISIELQGVNKYLIELEED